MEIQTDLNIRKLHLITAPQLLQYLLCPSINAATFLSRIQVLHVLLLRKTKLIKPLKNARFEGRKTRIIICNTTASKQLHSA